MTEIPGIPDVSAQVDQTYVPRLNDGDITTLLAQFPTLKVRAYGAADITATSTKSFLQNTLEGEN